MSPVAAVPRVGDSVSAALKSELAFYTPLGGSQGRKYTRMACKPDSVRPGPWSGIWWPFLWSRCCQRDQAADPGLWARKPWARTPARPLFGIAPGGACHAGAVASPPVGSYPTFSPLPPTWSGVSLRYRRWRSVLCGAFPRVAPAGRYPAPFFCGVRTFLAPFAKHAVIRPSA